MRQDDAAVSEVVGTTLLVAITVVLFAIFSGAVYQSVKTSPRTPATDFQVYKVGSTTTIVPAWGDPLSITDTSILWMGADGVRHKDALSAAPLNGYLTQSAKGSATMWDLGEALVLACPLGQACAYPGQTSKNITVLDRVSNSVVWSNEAGVAPAVVLTPVADLAVTVLAVRDPAPKLGTTMFKGGTAVVDLKVTNVGIKDTTAGTLNLRVYASVARTTLLVPDGSMSRTSVLRPGESWSVTSPAFALTTGGTFTLDANVTLAGATMREASMSNNDALYAYNVTGGLLDPGFAYEDLDNNGLFNPYLAADLAIDACRFNTGTLVTSSGAGTCTTTSWVPSKGLVIPASAGTISITKAANINWNVPNGLLYVGVDINWASYKSNKAITMTAGQSLTVAPFATISADNTLTLTGGTNLTLTDARLGSDGTNMVLKTTGGPILAKRAQLTASVDADPAQILPTSSSYVDFDGANFNSAREITIVANGADASGYAVHAAGATFDASQKPIKITGAGHMDVQGTVFRAGSLKTPPDQTLTFDILSNTRHVDVQGLQTLAKNSQARLVKPGTCLASMVVGSPAAGSAVVCS